MSTDERRAPHPMLVEIHADIRVLKDRQESMYERLFGNGQPGEIHHIYSTIEAVKSVAEEARQTTVNWRWWLAGSSATIVVAWLLLKELLK